MFRRQVLRISPLRCLFALFLYPIVQTSIVLNNMNFNVVIAEVIATTGILLSGYQEEYTTTIFSKSFSRIPKVLIGLTYMDLGISSILHFNFDITVSSVTTTQFQVVASKMDESKIYKLKFNYLAIDSDDVTIGTGKINFSSSCQLSPSGDYYYAKTTLPYARTGIDTTKWTRKINAFFTGYSNYLHSPVSATTKFSVQIDINYLATTFEIVFTSYDMNAANIINNISFNYIEFYQDTITDYYQMQQIMERHSAEITSLDDFFSGSGPRSHIAPASNVNIDRIDGIFYGLNSLTGSLANLPIRMRLLNPTYSVTSSLPQFTFTYETWLNTNIYQVTSDILVFTQKNCAASTSTPIYSDFSQTCLASCPMYYFSNTVTEYLGQNRLICSQCDTSCKQCNGNTANNCLECSNSAQFLYLNTCFSAQPDNTYCGGALNSCTLCTRLITGTTANMCKYCESDTTSCLECEDSTKYLYQGTCLAMQPISSYCDSNKKCYDCFPSCSSCTGSSNGQCTSCKLSFSLNNGFCVCPDSEYIFNSSLNQCFLQGPFTKKEVDTAKAYLSVLSTSGQSTAMVIALSSGFIKSSTSLLSQQLTIQKIFYLQIVNSNIPNFLFEFIHAFASNLNQLQIFFQTKYNLTYLILFPSPEQGITPKFSSTDFISPLVGDSSKDTIGYKLLKIEFPASIFQNCCGGLVLTIIIVAVQKLFANLIQTRRKDFILLLYEKVLANYFFQVGQLMVLVFYLGFAIQLTAFFIPNYEPFSIASYFLAVICFIIPIAILIFEYNTIRRTVYWLGIDHRSLMGILEDKISYNCIKDSMYSHCYVIIFSIIECIFFPSLAIYSRSTFQPAIILMIFLQIIEFIITVKLRPFVSKIDNYSYCVEQLIWIITFMTFCILAFQIKEREDDHMTDEPYPNLIVVLSLTVTIELLIIILISPITSLSQLIGQVVSGLKSRKKNALLMKIKQKQIDSNKILKQKNQRPTEQTINNSPSLEPLNKQYEISNDSL